jgi:hypothetical protein
VSEQLELDLGWPEGSYERYRNYFGRLVRCTVPVKFYSSDWHDGMRAQVYIGTICSCYKGGVCLQPPLRAQGVSEERGQCFPLTSSMQLEILPGKLRDYE